MELVGDAMAVVLCNETIEGVPAGTCEALWIEAGAVCARIRAAWSISTVMSRVFAGFSLWEANCTVAADVSFAVFHRFGLEWQV
jgi:hypothetical protein